MESYFSVNSPESHWRTLPTSFLICFFAYSLILFIEKVGFDSHSLTAHDHTDHDNTEVYNGNMDYNDKNLKEVLHQKNLINENFPLSEIIAVINTEKESEEHPKISIENYSPDNSRRKNINFKQDAKRKRSIMDTNCEHEISANVENNPDIEEATMKNVVSSKGKFVSLLQARNICKK